jgi:hypothetical protein
MKRLNMCLGLLSIILWHTTAAAQTYLPVGPQTNIPVATVTSGGWTQCYIDTYDFETLSTSTVLSQCTGSRLMLACRETSSGTLTLLAQADRSDVLFETGNNNNVLHTANGTGWYYDETGKDSWGFVRAGDSVSKNNCDTDSSGANGERLCWHLNPSNGGYRCGSTTSLNNSTAYERIVYSDSSNVVAAVPVPASPFWSLGLLGLILSAMVGRRSFRKRIKR